MEVNKEQTFRHSIAKLALMFFLVLFLGFFAIMLADQGNYFLFVFPVGMLLMALFDVMSSVKISNDEITITRLLGSKSLRWSEIARVSAFGHAVRLHNYDDLVLTLDSQLNGYADIVDIVFSKRPDLLDKNDGRVMSISWLSVISTFGISLFMIAIAIFQFLKVDDIDRIFSLLLFALGVSIIAKWFLSPISLTLKSKDITVEYWFKEVSYAARDIDYISLEKQRTKEGYAYAYFAQINFISGKKIKLSGLREGAFLTYQILKRWHKNANSELAAVRM